MNGLVISIAEGKKIVKKELLKEYSRVSKFIEKTILEPISDDNARKRFTKSVDRKAEVARKLRKFYD